MKVLVMHLLCPVMATTVPVAKVLEMTGNLRN
jgi:hypothetical protein